MRQKLRTTCPHRPAARIALAVLAVVVLASGAARSASDEMIAYDTEHYSIQTDLTPRFATIVGNHMETIYREYERRFEGYGKMTVRFDVRVFRTRDGYAQVVPKQYVGSTGIYIERGSKRLLAAHADGRTAEEVLRTLYHEGFHQFMYHVISKRCPIWLNEGLAEYFSEATWNGEGFETGIVPSSRLYKVQEAVRNGAYIPLAVLFAMSSDEWARSAAMDARRADLQYSQVWSVAQFLLHADNGRYAHLIGKFLTELNETRDQVEAFTKVFGTDVGAFERAWALYTMNLKPSPKSVCRDNMQSLMLLAKLYYDRPAEFTSVGDLRKRVMGRRRYPWAITRPDGSKVSATDKDAVARLFHCPFDRTGHSASYVVARSPQTGEPVLVCMHHPGIIIKAYYQTDDRGQLQVVIEEEVHETVRQDLRQAIAAAMR